MPFLGKGVLLLFNVIALPIIAKTSIGLQNKRSIFVYSLINCLSAIANFFFFYINYTTNKITGFEITYNRSGNAWRDSILS